MVEFIKSQRVYEALRWLVSVVMPAIATRWATLDAAWGWGCPMEAILATFTGVETFLGAVFLASKYSYDKNQDVEGGS